jgi:hypothetical protein
MTDAVAVPSKRAPVGEGVSHASRALRNPPSPAWGGWHVIRASQVGHPRCRDPRTDRLT